MQIVLKRSGIIKFLSLTAILLILIHIGILVAYFTIGNPKEFDFVQMWDLDMERNIPTLFSSAILLIAAFLFYLLSRSPAERARGDRGAWLGLSGIFTFLAFDESAKIHEQIGDYTENFVDASGYLYYPWVLSYSLLLLILAALYMRFFWRMERRDFWRFVLSAFIFLSGAIGMELLGAKEASLHGSDTLRYCVYYTIEESLEMFGVIYLIHILLDLLKDSVLSLRG
jgi:cytochrome bd-type quinol oxidase subunit 2